MAETRKWRVSSLVGWLGTGMAACPPRRQPQPPRSKVLVSSCAAPGGARTPRMRSRRTIHGRLPVGTALRNRGWELKQRLAGCQFVVDVFFFIVEGMFFRERKNSHAHVRAEVALSVTGGGYRASATTSKEKDRGRGGGHRRAGWSDGMWNVTSAAVGVFLRVNGPGTRLRRQEGTPLGVARPRRCGR
jgi:hypothetical protein